MNRLQVSRLVFFDFLCSLAKTTALRATTPILHTKLIYRFTNLYAEERKGIKYLNEVAQKVVSSALEERKTELSNRTGVECDDTKPKILIDKLLDLEEKGLLDRRRVLGQIVTFFATVSEAEYNLGHKQL